MNQIIVIKFICNHECGRGHTLVCMCVFICTEVKLYCLTMHAIFNPGDEKEHLKVTLLRIDSSLQGVLSCLPDFTPSSRNGTVEHPNQASFLIAGATGSSVGSTKLREKATEIIHAACK